MKSWVALAWRQSAGWALLLPSIVLLLMIGLLVFFAGQPKKSPTGEFNAEEFASLEIVPTDLGHISPAHPYDYWEWRSELEYGREVVASGGTFDRTELSTEMQETLETTYWDDPGWTDCFGPWMQCAEYVVAVSDSDIVTMTTEEGVHEFLGEIDTPEDALLLAAAHGNNHLTELVSSTQDGYEILVEHLTVGDLCSGGIEVFIVQELLEIGRAGEISVVARKIRDEFCGMP